MKVFKSKYGWTTTFHNKMQNGEDMKYYMSVQFMRGFEPTVDSIDIEPVRWWGSCYLTREGEAKPKLFIAEWREIVPKIGDTFEAETMAEYLHKEEDNTEEINIEQEELPFY